MGSGNNGGRVAELFDQDIDLVHANVCVVKGHKPCRSKRLSTLLLDMTMEQRTGIIYSSKLPVLTSRYAFRPKQLQPLPNIMEKVSPQSNRSKSVMFYKNGDKFFQGHHVVLTQRKYRSFDSLLNELTRVTKLPHGVRFLLTPTSGRRVNSLEQLEDGKSYIASSFSKLRRIHYGPTAMKNNENLEPLNHNKKEILTRKVDNIRLKPLNYNPDAHKNDKQRSVSRAPVIKPRLITVVRNGFKPRRVVKVLLNRRTAQNFEQVLDDVTSAVGVIGGSGVRKLFTVEGKQVQGLSDLLNSENDIFIAVGDEKFYGHDLQDILKDLNLNVSTSESKPTKHHKRHSQQEHESIKFTDKDEHSNISHGRVSIKDDANTKSVSSNNNNKANKHVKLPHINEADQGSHPKDTDVNTTAKQKDNVLPPIDVNNNEEKDRNSKKNDSDKISNISSPRKAENEKSPRNESKLDITPEEPPEQKKAIENIREMFEIGRKLGDGNFAVVRECFHKTTNEKYALKIIDRSKLKGKEKMLENEIHIMKRCNHANIVKLFDDFHARTEIYLVMELVQGGDLFDAISTSVKFTEPVAANYLHDVCSSLHYLHKRKIVHRDLKPENLLVRNLS